MNKQKLSYTAPVAETFVVQAEGVICDSIIKTLGMLSIPGADQGFGDSAASIEDKSSENWW